MTPDEREWTRKRDELELTPGAPITVALPDGWTTSSTVVVTYERVLTVNDIVINYGDGRSNSVRREDEGKTWARGWNTKDANALEAQLILQRSA